MKKLLLSALALTLVFSMTACGNNEETGSSNPSTMESESTPAETPSEETPATEESSGEVPDENEETPSTEESSDEAPVDGEASGETLGTTILGVFNDALAQDAEKDALTLAGEICAHESVSLIGPMTMEVEPGYLTGFNNYEVTGFEQGVMFAPMIGSIPFVGYVFTLPADADADAFVTGLKDNADLRWNICVEADEMIAEANGNKVFFLMCPATLEQ